MRSKASAEILGLRDGSDFGTEIEALLEAHLMILKDRKVSDEIEREIREGRRPADYCVRATFERYAQKLELVKDGYYAERAKDIRDIEHRVLRVLSGARQHELSCLTTDVVVVAHDLTPGQTVALDRKRVKGMAIDVGGPTSHTAIVSRSLGIPAVVGLKDLTGCVREGLSSSWTATTGVCTWTRTPRRS